MAAAGNPYKDMSPAISAVLHPGQASEHSRRDRHDYINYGMGKTTGQYNCEYSSGRSGPAVARNRALKVPDRKPDRFEVVIMPAESLQSTKVARRLSLGQGRIAVCFLTEYRLLNADFISLMDLPSDSVLGYSEDLPPSTPRSWYAAKGDVLSSCNFTADQVI